MRSDVYTHIYIYTYTYICLQPDTDVFAGAEGKARFGYLLEQQGQQQGQGPMLHVYCFSKAADPERDALDVRLRVCMGRGDEAMYVCVPFFCTQRTDKTKKKKTQRLARALGLEGKKKRLEKAHSDSNNDSTTGSGGVRIHHVRDVAPKKPMFCLSFPLRLAWED